MAQGCSVVVPQKEVSHGEGVHRSGGARRSLVGRRCGRDRDHAGAFAEGGEGDGARTGGVQAAWPFSMASFGAALGHGGDVVGLGRRAEAVGAAELAAEPVTA